MVSSKFCPGFAAPNPVVVWNLMAPNNLDEFTPINQILIPSSHWIIESFKITQNQFNGYFIWFIVQAVRMFHRVTWPIFGSPPNIIIGCWLAAWLVIFPKKTQGLKPAMIHGNVWEMLEVFNIDTCIYSFN